VELYIHSLNTPSWHGAQLRETQGQLYLLHLEVKLSLYLTKNHAMKTCLGNGATAPRIFNLVTRWKRVVSSTLRSLYLRSKSRRYPLHVRLGRPQSRSGRGGEEKKSHHCPFRELNHGHPAHSLVSILTESFRFLLEFRSVS
jgi:hypothetical protein